MRAHCHRALSSVTPHDLSARMTMTESKALAPSWGSHTRQQLAVSPAGPRQQRPHGWPQTWLPVPQWLRSCHLLPLPWQMRQPRLQRWARAEAWVLRCWGPPPGCRLLHAWLLLPLPPDLSWLQGLPVLGLAPWLPSTSQLEAAVVEAEQPALPPTS